MPWWGKKRSRDDPEATPKLSSVALPEMVYSRGFPPHLDNQPWTSISVHRSRIRGTLDGNTTMATGVRTDVMSGYVSETAAKTSRQRATSVVPDLQYGGHQRMSRQVDSRERNRKMPLAEINLQEANKSQPRGRIASTSGVRKGILKPPKPSTDDEYVHKPMKPTQPNKIEPSSSTHNYLVHKRTGSSSKSGGSEDSHSHHYRRDKEKLKDHHKGYESENTMPRAATFSQRPQGHPHPPPFYSASAAASQSKKPLPIPRPEFSQGQRAPPSNYFPPPRYADGHGSYNPENRGTAEIQRVSSCDSYTRPQAQCFGMQRAPSYGSQQARYSAAAVAASHAPYQTSVYPPMRSDQSSEFLQRQYRTSVSGGNLQPSAPVPDQRYVRPTIVRRVPQKEEEISLSWPFIDPATKAEGHQRRKLPHLYFDIGMDPTDGTRGVRAYVSNPGVASSFRLLTADEKNVPASSHCTLKRLVIYCKENGMDRWPIVAERQEGLRCIDVFDAIYRTFAVPLTAEEVRMYSNEFLESCVPAFRQRCRNAAGRGIGEKDLEKRGFCRVDLLRTHKIFQGLTKKGRESTWTLTLQSPGPSRVVHAPGAATVH